MAVLVLLVVVGLPVLAGLLLASLYNRLVQLRVGAAGAWSDIAVQLKRRYDLVPNLVETVRGYASHESATLTRVIEARQAAQAAASGTGAGDAVARAALESQLTGALRQLFAVSEAYPALRAVESFTALQESLQQVEEALQNARRYYNAVVRDYNMALQQFPSNLVAGWFAFAPRAFFELDAEQERQAPAVRF